MAARLTAYIVAVIVGSTVIAGLIVGAQRADDGPVDLMVVNGRVYTADGEDTTAEALAIQGNKILRVGSTREIQRLRRPQTLVIDAKGGTVLPGLTEANARLLDEADPDAPEPDLAAPPGDADELTALRRAIADAHRRGITSVHTVGSDAEDFELYDTLRRRNELTIRVYGAVAVPPDATDNDLDALDELRDRFPDDPVLKAGAAEIAFGRGDVTRARLSHLVSELDKREWQIVLKPRDDAALELALDAYTYALTTTAAPARGRRHRIEPLGLVGPVDYRPFDKLGVLHAEPVGAGDTKEAVDALTREAAWASFDDHRKGSLVRDMLADVVVFSTDIMGQPAAELDDAEVTVTIFDGKVVYRRSAETDR